MNQIERGEFYRQLGEEKALRESIRNLIRFVKQKKENQQNDLRNLINKVILQERKILETATPDNDPTPNKTTGINVLEDLLKKIIPILEDDYKLLTTDLNQRQSFRAHIVHAVVKSLAPAKANDQAETLAVQEAIEVNVGDEDEEMPPEFIDIDKDGSTPEKEVSPEEEFGAGLEGTDETGRNMAYQTFKKVEKAVLDAYELLSNPDDRELFYDYLLANLKLYFDRFETELDVSVEEPESAAYDQAQAQATEVPGELGTELA